MPEPYKHVIASERTLDMLQQDELRLEAVKATYAIAERLEAVVGKLEDLERTVEVSGANAGAALQDLSVNLNLNKL